MNPLLHKLMHRLQNRAGDGLDLSGVDTSIDHNADLDDNADRGDGFTPSDDTPAPAAKMTTPDEDDEPAPASKAGEKASGDPEDDAMDGGTDGDGDAEAEAKADGKGKADGGKARDTRIPLSRHKAILERERAQREDLQRQLAQFQKGAEVSNLNATLTKMENEALELEQEYNKLIAAGEVQKATEAMGKLRRLDAKIADTKSDMKLAVVEARAVERTRYSMAVERIENEYPELNPDDEKYDEALSNEVVELKEAYELKGYTPTAAMQKAVRTLVKPRTAAQKDAITVTPRVTEADLPSKDRTKVATERKETGARRSADATSRQPSSLNRTGLDSDKAGGGLSAKDVMQMTQEDFMKLSDEQLAQMRGDTLG